MPKNTISKDVALSAIEKMGEIDPMAIIIMAAAGTAGLAGIPGPLTNILDSMSKGNSPVANSAKSIVVSYAAVQSPILTLITMLGSQPQNAASDTTPEALKAVGIAASNVVEAGLMYTLVRNPETMKTLSEIAKEAAKGAVGLAKVAPLPF